MNKIYLFFLFVITACTGLQENESVDFICRNDQSKETVKNLKKGFCGSDSYRITATGAPEKNEKDRKRRRKQATKGAMLAAHYHMREAFEGHCFEQAMMGFPEGYAERKAAWKKDIRKMVKKGKVIFSTCDAEDNCTVLYELRIRGLRKK